MKVTFDFGFQEHMSSKPVNVGGSTEETKADWVGKEAFAGPSGPGNSVWPEYEIREGK